MNPNFPPPQPDPNSSSLAYLNHHPPGTQAHYLPVQGNPPRLRNAPAPDRALPNPQRDQMDIDTGDDNDGPARDASSDNEAGRGLKRARPDTSETETLEHSEPVCKQRRTEPPELAPEEPVAASVLLSPEAIKAELRQAAIDGHLGRLQSLIKQADHLKISDEVDEFVWEAATRHGHLAIVEWLYGQADKFGLQKPESIDISFEAAEHGRLHIIQWLAEQGCNIHQVNNYKNNALTLAASRGHLEVIQWLADQGCNIRQINNYGDNALTRALSNVDVNECGLDLVQYLLGKGCDIDHQNEYGRTALFFAMNGQKIDIACHLITQGANVHIGFPPESGGSLFTALNIENPALINLLIPLHDLSRRSANGSTPLMIAAEENLIEVAVPLIQATAKLSAGLKLIGEAFSVATGLLFKELLSNVFFTGDGPLPHSDLWANSGPTFMSGVIYQYVCSQYSELPYLQASLGSAGTMTTAQIKAAKVGVLAELPAWKLHHPVESLFNEELPPTLLSVRKKIITFINDDIEVLATQALQWEEDHLIPVVENLYASCLSHSLSAQAAIDIISELTGKGLYYPIAQKMANAWVTVWTSVSADAAPILRPSAPTHIEDWDFEDLTDLDPLTGDVAANSNTIARNIDNFVGTPVGSALLEAFRAALRREFDSVGGGILRVEGANLSEQSKALYADLIARQLHLIAQFWRAES